VGAEQPLTSDGLSSARDHAENHPAMKNVEYNDAAMPSVMREPAGAAMGPLAFHELPTDDPCRVGHRVHIDIGIAATDQGDEVAEVRDGNRALI